jgi:hypothetical protein
MIAVSECECDVALFNLVSCRLPEFECRLELFVFQVTIKEARGLPPVLTNCVYCQYSFWGTPEPVIVSAVVPPDDGSGSRRRLDEDVVVFNHQRASVNLVR